MKILLSAYACTSGVGSEPGVGWNWAIGLARSGHDVWVLTRSVGRKSIEAACAVEPYANLHFVYYDLPSWFWSLGVRAEQLRYQFWQWGVFRTASKLQRQVKFDVLHHITLGIWRHHLLTPLLDVPFVFGPVGGGEAAPLRLRKSFPIRGKTNDLIRDAINVGGLLDPILRMVFRRATLITCKTADTAQLIPAKYRKKCIVRSEIGAPAISATNPRKGHSELRVLFAGRLLFWKGIHLALNAVARAAVLIPTIRFTIVGDGPDEPWLRKLAAKLGLEQQVEWLGKIPQHKLLELYADADVFLFPSLHDSSGNVVLESLSRGLPVVCLDLGGPAQFVDESCGRVIGTHGQTEEQVSSAIADALRLLASDKALHSNLREGALRKAEAFKWDSVIGDLYKTISSVIDQRKMQSQPLRAKGH